MDLFVRHLHESVDDRVLFAAFEPYDDLLNARVQTDDDGYSKGTEEAFAYMSIQEG